MPGRQSTLPSPVHEAGRTSVLPIIDKNTVAARHVEVHSAVIWPESPLHRDAEMDVEQVLYIKQGSLQADIGDQQVQAGVEDWIFIPPGCALHAVALGPDPVRGFLIRGLG